MKRNKAILLFTLLFALAAASVLAQSAGSVRGKILDPNGKPLSGVAVQLRNDITGVKQTSITANDGGFFFANVPYNPYEILVDVQGFQTEHIPVDIHSPVPVQQTMNLQRSSVSESVTVT